MKTNEEIALEAAEKLSDEFISNFGGLREWPASQRQLIVQLFAPTILQCLTQAQESRERAFAKLEQDLWALRQRVLGMGMGDPWDGEELENGFVRPIPAGFEDEVAKFDKMHSQQIKESNECLEVISELAMRCRTLSEASPIPSPGAEATIEDAARFLEKKSRDHWSEHGSHEPDTGAPGPEAVVEYCDLLDELAAEIRALKPSTPEGRS
jgi:hypothetical protein